ncbi:MAG TPA: hypothetical protein DC049_08030 [Spirochaetia bacterium]|nr:hypothetical protein [Spirochaetia bacterium]
MESEVKFQIVNLPVDSIEIIPGENPRQDFDGLFELKDSIEKIGQIDEVIVHMVDGKMILLGGECRVRVAKELKKPFIMAKVFESIDTLTELRLSSGNNKHKALNPLEQARDMQRYVDRLGWTTKQVAVEFGVTEETVARRLKLVQLPDEIKLMIARKTNPLPVHQALMVAALPKRAQYKAAQEIAPTVGQVMTEQQAKEYLDKFKGAKLIEDPKPGEVPDPAANDNKIETPARETKTRSLGDLKPVDVMIAIRGKLFATSKDEIEILKAKVAINIYGDDKKIQAELDIPYDRFKVPFDSRVLALIKKYQPKKSKSKKEKSVTKEKSKELSCPNEECSKFGKTVGEGGGFALADEKEGTTAWRCLACGEIVFQGPDGKPL